MSVSRDGSRYACFSGVSPRLPPLQFKIHNLDSPFRNPGPGQARDSGPEFGQPGKRISPHLIYGGKPPWTEGGQNPLDQFKKAILPAFSPDGSRIAVAEGQGRVTVVDATSGDAILSSRMFSGQYPTGPPNDICFDPTGKIIAVAELNNLLVFDSDSGKVHFERRAGAFISRLCFSPDGKILAVAEGSFQPSAMQLSENFSCIQLWNVETGELMYSLAGHIGNVHDISFDSTGVLLVSGGSDKTVRIWNVKQRKQTKCMLGHDQAVTCVAFGPTGRHVLSGDYGGFLRVFEIAPPPLPTETKSGVAAIHRNGTVHVIKQGPEREVVNVDASTGTVRSLSLAKAGTLMVSAGESLELWDPNSGDRIMRFAESLPIFDCVACSSDGRFVFTAFYGLLIRPKGIHQFWAISRASSSLGLRNR